MKRLAPFLLAAASGAVLALALPLVVPGLSLREVDPRGWLEPLAWVALVPAFLALRAAPRARRAFALGLVAGLAYFYLAIYWVSHAMTAFGGLPVAVAFPALSLLVLFMAVHWAVAFAVVQRVRARLGWPLHLVLPPAWAALELVRNYLCSGFPWANLGYTQVRTLPVAQLAAVTGVYGLAALVALVNAVLAEALAARREGRPWPVRALAGTAALLVAVVAYGYAHLASTRARMAAAPALVAGIVQPNVDQSTKNHARDHRAYILDRLVPPTQQADRAGADLVVWPEAAYPLYVSPAQRTFAVPGAGLPALSRAHVLVGAATLEWGDPAGGGRERVARVGNYQFLVTPGLEVLGSYQKHHLVPFGEYVPRWITTLLPFVSQLVPAMGIIVPGEALRTLSFERAPGDEVRLAPLICFDAIFPEISRAYAAGPDEPEVLVNPTNDAWYGYSSGPYQFLAIVRMRAIETGKAVLRPAYAGVSAAILPTGELAPGAIEVGPVDPDLAPDPDEPARLLVTTVPRLRGRTLYTTVGDLFALACVAFTVAALAVAWRRRPVPGPGPTP